MTSTSSQSAIACIYALTVPFIMAIPNYKHGDTETLALTLYKSKQPLQLCQLISSVLLHFALWKIS